MIENTVPNQRIPFRMKNKKWREASVNYYISRANLGYTMDRSEYSGATRSMTRNRIHNMVVNFDLYNSRYQKSDIEYITNPFGQPDSTTFPTNMQNINVIRPGIDYLIGEKSQKSGRVMVFDCSPEMVDTMKQLQYDMIIESIVAEVEQFIDPENQSNIATLEEINHYINNKYSNPYEKAGQFLVNQFRKELELDIEFVEAWKNRIIAGEAMMFIGRMGDSLVAENVNPTYVDYERHPGMSIIDNASWVTRKFFMSPGKIANTWTLTAQELDDIGLTNNINNVPGFGDDYAPYIRRRMSDDMYMTMDSLPVYHCVWESLAEIGIVTKQLPDGTTEKFVVDEEYKIQPNETVEWHWDKQWWEGYRIADKTFKDIRPILDNENPYVGDIQSNTNSENISLVGLTKPLAYWFLETMYRLQLTIARDKGKIINIDVTQIPKSMGIDFNSWIHYLSSVGINLINPYETGWDVARGPGTSASFNQFGSVDLTMANVINEYVILLGKIELMIGRIMGVPDQRLGEVKASENVGNVQQVLAQSATVTEPYYTKQAFFERRVYTRLLNLAKALAATGELNLLSSFDNVTREFITIPDGLKFKDLRVFVSNSNEDFKKLEIIRQIGQSAVSSGGSVYEAAIMATTDDISEIKNELKRIDKMRNDMQQQQTQAQTEMENARIQMEIEQRDKDRELKKYEIDSNNSTKIQTAEIQSYMGMENRDLDNSGIPDTMEIAKQSLEEQKHNSDIFLRDQEGVRQEKMHNDEMQLKNRELNLKEKEISSKEKIEQLKAKTAKQVASTNRNKYSK